MAAKQVAKQVEARVIIGLDFGTTFSGFSFALKNDANIKAADGYVTSLRLC